MYIVYPVGCKVKDGSEGVIAEKRVLLLNLPHTLVLHLMRFTYTTGAGKLHKPVRFGTMLKYVHLVMSMTIVICLTSTTVAQV